MFEILRASSGGYFWRLKGGNGETLCHSEVYTSKQSAQNGVDAAKRLAPIAQVYDKA
ncbi:YegP family protein [Rhizobium sp. R634]|uniref:YegP family protein n=1 Tax=Rhizobium sp. R634 TaxID=1764274 RepID=UPI000B52CD85|nr:YegP family protein [Rhizobium sp. R634]